jgi:predicted transcriptional regulator
MATTGNNLRIPDELREQAAEIARRQGRTADDLAADALRRYIAHERLEELARYGRDRAKELGLDKPTEEEAVAFVERVIGEDRTERHR